MAHYNRPDVIFRAPYDRETAFEDFRLGRLRHQDHHEEHAHRQLRRARRSPTRRAAIGKSRYLDKGQIWCFTLNNRWVIDAHVGGNVARYINHSCKPNCYSWIKDGVIWIRAARNIALGEELSYDYNTTGNAKIPCRCRPGCKNSL